MNTSSTRSRSAFPRHKGIRYVRGLQMDLVGLGSRASREVFEVLF